MNLRSRSLITIFFLLFAMQYGIAQAMHSGPSGGQSMVAFSKSASADGFTLASFGHAASIYVAAQNPETVHVVAEAFAGDVEQVAGIRPQILSSLSAPPRELVLAGVIGDSPEIDSLRRQGKIHTEAIEGKWESALITVVQQPMPGVSRALVVAGSDRRGVAFALFTISRQMGVSPWTWWADVPVQKHRSIFIRSGVHLQGEPSVRYRGIFINDEDWGFRPWAARKMDPELHNVGPHTYARVFELLLRLRANSLWPAMHPGTLAFNDVPENARLADKWAIVMGASHSEALLRNNAVEWDEKRDGAWNYQTNSAAIKTYWEKRLAVNGHYENFYTVGMRGVHDSGLEATGTPQEKARLLEGIMADQRTLLGKYVNKNVESIPQVIWLYKEALDLYRAGMHVPDDVMLGWTDDNYGYLRQLPTDAEQKRAGGSGVYYHISYAGPPHDYLWLCSTPPALIREEMTKAFDHNVRRYWIANVGDIKPAEQDIDYFMQLAWDEPHMASISQKEFIESWTAEQFPGASARGITDVIEQYYKLNFVRKPEHMGFNGFNDDVKLSSFNPLAWGDQNRLRSQAWQRLSRQAAALQNTLPQEYHNAFFELVAYPVEASAAQNEKFLATDRSFLDASLRNIGGARSESAHAQMAYDRVQSLTAEYNAIAGGKWDGMMSAAPRERHVFEMPETATSAATEMPLPTSWKRFSGDAEEVQTAYAGKGSSFVEENATVSINAAHFSRKHDGDNSAWKVLSDLGISGDSVGFGSPGLLANADSAKTPPVTASPWLEYDFDTTSHGDATLTLALLPTFPVDSRQRLRYAVALDGHSPVMMDASGKGDGAWEGNSSPVWSENVLRNASLNILPLGSLTAGHHTLRLIYQDPAVIFEHLTVTFAGAPPAYPVPPETIHSIH
jgi:hypothetical protein